MTQEEKYLQWMEEYFSEDDGNNLKAELILASDNGKLSTIWSSIVYGRLGMYVRNYMRNAHPEIDSEFEYGKFEDYSWELIQKLVEKWKSNAQNVEVQDVDSRKDNDLLLKDLCGRLLYGVKGIVEDGIKVTTPSEWPIEKSIEFSMRYMVIKNGWRPYLFPLSSMTAEQKYGFYCRLIENDCGFDDFKEFYLDNGMWIKLFTSLDDVEAIIDWLNKNHFDYRGLIEKGLAIDATGKNIY
jgi:hypothetical protein